MIKITVSVVWLFSIILLNAGINLPFAKPNIGTENNILSNPSSLLDYFKEQKVSRQDTQKWKNETWEDSLRYEFNYNVSGQLEEAIYDLYETGDFNAYGRYVFTYNSTGDISALIWQDYSDSQWLNNYKYSYFYDTSEKLVQCIYSTWNSGDWLGISQGLYEYDNENIILETWQYWLDENTLVNQTKDIYLYDENNSMIENTHQIWQNETWQNSYRFNYQYENENNTFLLYQYWDQDMFNDSYRYVYDYDTNNNLSSALYQEFNEGWFDVSQGEYILDENDNITQETWQQFYNGIPENYIRYLYFYDEISSVPENLTQSNEMKMTVYPNPYRKLNHRNSLTVSYELKADTKVDFAIYNIKGEKIEKLSTTTFQQKGVHKMNFNPLDLVNGVYLCNIQTNNKISTKKLLIIK